MTLTPMMKQYHDAKEQNPDALLLFRMGDFYELFFQDAEVIARELQLTLTTRDGLVPMAGFPHHQFEPYLRRLIQAGHRVAVCEQVEDPQLAKGLVKREVVRVVTPGTLIEDSLLDPRQSNHLAALCVEGDRAGLAWADPSTGLFQAADIPIQRLSDELSRLEVAECLWPEGVPYPDRLTDTLAQLSVTFRQPWTFETRAAHEALLKHFGVQTMQGFGFEDEAPCLRAAGALLLYLHETLRANLAHLHRLKPYQPGEVLVLDSVTRRSLELVRTLREGRREGSLLHAIDRTATAMGARLLQDWLLTPLTNGPAIDARLEAVAELKANPGFRRQLRELLTKAHDLSRLTSRVTTGRASPRDLGAVARTLALLPALKAIMSARQAPLLQELESQIELCPDIRKTLESALIDEPPLSPKEGGFLRPGFHAELDCLRDLSRGGKEWIARFQATEIERTGIPNLKVGFNKVFGYYIEITNAQASKVPADYQRKQTTKNAERYITPQLKEYEDQVLRAEEKAMALEYDLFVQLRDQVGSEGRRLLQTANVLAQWDVLGGLADLADTNDYVRPKITPEPILEIDQGRHPVIAQLLAAGVFVPNDTWLGGTSGLVTLITGPNMSGKSTYIRQVALLTLLAHIGSFVPATRAVIGLTDRIFTRVGASDELSRGQSTFMVEMTETANILNNATGRSLVILDEIGRGTSTYDGVSIAWAVTEHLHSKIGCRSFFATHYHELTQLSESLPGLKNYHAEVHDEGGQVVFLHRIVPGAADRSYGIHVGQLAGLPKSVLKRAQQVLDVLESQHEASATTTRQRRPTRKSEVYQPTLFERDPEE